MTVGELLDRISSRELSEWMAYYAIEPFGEERADLRNGVSTSTIVNHLRALGGARQRTAVTDYLLFLEEPSPDTQELYSKVRSNPVFGHSPRGTPESPTPRTPR